MPPVAIRCPRCHRSVELRHARVGQITCPHCGHRWVPRRDRGATAAPSLPPLAPRPKPLIDDSPPTPARSLPPAKTTPPMPLSTAQPPTEVAEQAEQVRRSQAPRSRARIRVSDIITQSFSDRSSGPSAAAASPELGEGLGLLDSLAAGEGAVAPRPEVEEEQAPRSRVAAPAAKADAQRLWQSQKDPLVGRELRGLRIERKIGEGGMGSVYEALQLSLDRKVALKVLSPRLRGNKSFINKLETEAKILARVNHPNILHVYDFGEEQSIAIYYMVMEFIDGSDLTEVLQRRRRLGQVEALEIIRQAAEGLDAAAQNGIIHRDVKPDNIMITKEGICKVSDFGLATNIGMNEGAEGGKMRVGTPAFMSPEQCQGAILDVRSDVYSLGCTAYVALTGQLPFEAESPFEIMLQHRTVPAPSLRSEHAAIDREVEEVVHRMMAKRPSDRFASMAQLAAALKTIIDRLLREGSNDSHAPATIEIKPDMPDWLSE